MKLLKLLSAPLILATLCSTTVKAQSDLKLLPFSGLTDSIPSTLPDASNFKLTPFSYKSADSLQNNLRDSLNFNKKPSYNAFNAPVPIPNSFKPQKHLAAVAMPVLKILLKKEE